jgi:hypothetical protein
METRLVRRIATDSWRLSRVSAIEDNLFALALHERGGNLCLGNTITPVCWNGQALSPQWAGAAKRPWSALQAARKAEHAAAMKEAATLLKLSEMRGLEYQPAKDGFGFANDQIHAAIDREQRLERASTIDHRKYKTRKFQNAAA